MKRREFVALVGGAMVGWPLALRAQGAKSPTVGILGTSTPSAWSAWMPAFLDRLRELGWIDGRNVALEYRWAEGRSERFTALADEFVRLKVDVIVTSGTAVLAAKQATSTIPIVFTVAVDPVGSGFVASLARPGGNVTGLSIQSPDLVGKRLEFLRDVVPELRGVGIMGNGRYPAAVLEISEVETASRTLGLEAIALKIERAGDIEPAITGLRGRAEVLYIVTESFLSTHRVQISTVALAAKLPAISAIKEFAAAGALISYGAHYPDQFRRAAEFVDKILRGAKPADLPVEQPTRFELVINLKTAKALGLTIPSTLLARADEVIE